MNGRTMPQKQTIDLVRLEAALRKINQQGHAEFERIIAHIDQADPDQLKLIQPEIDRILDDMKQRIAKVCTDEILRIALFEPMKQFLSTVDFSKGGFFKDGE